MSEEKTAYRIEGRPATIFRTMKNKDNPFVMIDRRPVDNAELSFKAKGILTYLMSRPDGWEVSVTDLVRHGTDGEASIRAGLKELRDAGHMKYTTSRKEGRITGWLIEVYEVPNIEFTENSPDGDFLHVENLQVENQDVENRRQVLKTLSSTELKKNTSAKIADVPPPLDWQIATGQPIRMPTKEQEFEAAVDIAAMKICQAGADLEPLAKAFMRARGMTPATRREYKTWGAALRELKTANVTPEAVTSAVTRLKKDNLTIADPWAIIKTARDISTRATTEKAGHKPVIRSLE